MRCTCRAQLGSLRKECKRHDQIFAVPIAPGDGAFFSGADRDCYYGRGHGGDAASVAFAFGAEPLLAIVPFQGPPSHCVPKGHLQDDGYISSPVPVGLAEGLSSACMSLRCVVVAEISSR